MSDIHTNELPETGFIRLPMVAKLTGLGRSTIWEKARKGQFPKPVRLSARVSAWRVEDVRAWIANPYPLATQNQQEAA